MSTQGRIFLSPPHMGGNELTYVHEAFASNYIAPLGPMVERFEADFAKLSGIPHCLALSSGTAAIHLALRGLGVSRGDIVFASDLTFIGGIAPILYLGATPVFIDADEATWTMNPALLAQALSDARKLNQLPRAVLPTDLYGQSCDLNAICKVCEEFDVPLVVDAAESVGATYGQRHAGDRGVAACYSFNGNKIITTSGGGMLASHDRKFIEEARNLSQQARLPAAHYEHTTYGYNYRMSNICAAIGVGQLEVLAARVARRRAIFDYYRSFLGDLPGISFMPEAPYGKGNRWLSVMLVDPAAFGADRETVRKALEKADIEARPVWKPMHLQPVFGKRRVVGSNVSARLFERGLCLPSGTAMDDEDLARIVEIVRDCYRN